MLKLVLKDLLAARLILLLVVPLYAVQLLGLAGSPPAFLLATLLFTTGFAFGSIALEEAQNTEILWCSLPTSRRGIVFARYLTMLLGTSAGLGMSWAVGHLTSRWMSSGTEEASYHLQPTIYAALFLLLLLAGSIFLPCYFRLGAGRGLALFSIIILVLTLFTATGATLFIHLTENHLPRSPDPYTLSQVKTWLERWGSTLAVALGGSVLVPTAVSATFAAMFYENRDC